MARKPVLASLTSLLDESSRPIYVVDGRRRIVYCNLALATWLDLEPHQIVGRLVEYHSEAAGVTTGRRDATAPLADLCPPPRALAGEACKATISCVSRDGRLNHRQAEFVPLESKSNKEQRATLVLVAADDMSPHELTTELSAEPSADDLHRTIRQFRRSQAAQYALESLLGDSSAMRKVRSQVAAAAASGANVLICGPPGSGRAHVARAIHFHAPGEIPEKLVPFDCEVLSDNLLRRAIDILHSPTSDERRRSTLLLENLESLSAAHQAQLLPAIRHNALTARIIATCSRPTPSAAQQNEMTPHKSPAMDAVRPTDGRPGAPSLSLDPALVDVLSTITIRVPCLVDRTDDLPILAQCFLEACNRGGGKQVGSVRPDALDLLALHSWPGELDELRGVIAAAHRACASHEIAPADLPAVVHHARQAASRARRPAERIVLDQLLAEIEKEAITRALMQAGGNKTEAADLLGMTRPRLYRRLVQLGFVVEASSDPEPQGPEFIEREPTDAAP